MTAEEIKAIAQNAMREALSARNTEDEIEALKTKNAELEKEIEALKGKKGEAENEAYEGKETPEEEEAEKKEGATLENAKPSQALVAAFATAMNVDFGAKTPSFATLAKLSGITETDPVARITAVNAKFAELSAAVKKPAESKVEVF